MCSRLSLKSSSVFHVEMIMEEDWRRGPDILHMWLWKGTSYPEPNPTGTLSAPDPDQIKSTSSLSNIKSPGKIWDLGVLSHQGLKRESGKDDQLWLLIMIF